MILSNGQWLLPWPLAQHIITAGWYYSDGSEHRAIDLRAAVGTPCFGVAGTVDWVQSWDGKTKTGQQSYGNAIRIRCDNLYRGRVVQCVYAHLSTVFAKVGDHITDGQIIGRTGNTGNSTGPHLHFEVRCDTVRTNPLNWLDADFTVSNGYVRLGKFTSVQPPKEKPALQTVCIVNPTDDIYAKAVALGLPIVSVPAKMIGPASKGDVETMLSMCLENGCYFMIKEE